MIIDPSYFISKPLFIPGAATQPGTLAGTPTKKDELKMFIDEKEQDLLLSFLGYEQYTELLSQFTDDGAWITTPLQKWVYLVDGKDEWRGLRYTAGDKKVSLIAYYVYFYFLGEDSTKYTTTGVEQPAAENSESVMPNQRQVNAWSKFLTMYGFCNTSLNPAFFNNCNGTGMMWNNGNQNRNIVSLYDFMSRNSDVYDLSFFASYRPVNIYNL